MPSNATGISQSYVAGELQWPIHRDASVCGLFRGLGRSRSGQNPLPAVAKQATEGIADVQSNPPARRSTQKFYSVKMLDRSNSGCPDPLVIKHGQIGRASCRERG